MFGPLFLVEDRVPFPARLPGVSRFRGGDRAVVLKFEMRSDNSSFSHLLVARSKNRGKVFESTM